MAEINYGRGHGETEITDSAGTKCGDVLPELHGGAPHRICFKRELGELEVVQSQRNGRGMEPVEEGDVGIYRGNTQPHEEDRRSTAIGLSAFNAHDRVSGDRRHVATDYCSFSLLEWDTQTFEGFRQNG